MKTKIKVLLCLLVVIAMGSVVVPISYAQYTACVTEYAEGHAIGCTLATAGQSCAAGKNCCGAANGACSCAG